MENNINKEEVLSALNLQEAFQFYLSPFCGKANLKPGVNISNPLISRKQKTPSFNYYEMNGSYMFKDFATGDSGDIIELVKRLFKLDFKEVLNRLCVDFSILPQAESIKIEFSEWNDKNLKYWRMFGVTKEILEEFGVKPVISFERRNKNGAPYIVKCKDNDPTYAYKVSDFCYKLYSPLNPPKKFSWLGKKPTSYLFGEKLLMDRNDIVYLAAGEKDVLSLTSHGYAAVCLNSETANLTREDVGRLKRRTKELVVLYDIDSTGLKHSEKISKEHGLGRLLIPEELLEEGENDVSDLFKRKETLSKFEKDIEYFDSSIPSRNSKYIPDLKKMYEYLKNRMTECITEPEPILSISDCGVIFQNTINIIQGKAGVHKSRFAETLCSAIISKSKKSENFLGFKMNNFLRPMVAYVDTERNVFNQFPNGLKSILKKAGYTEKQLPENFHFNSILKYPRKERFDAVNGYIEDLRARYKGPLVVILDVITDCIRDFNRSEDSMQLIDLMNTAINEFDITFIGLIHENPGNGDKARGHLGTELMNKASNVMQIGYEKDKNGKPTDLISVNFLKSRSTRRLDPLFLSYSQEKKGLVLATEEEKEQAIHSKQIKADIPKVIEYLEKNFRNEYKNRELITELEEEFICSQKLIRERIKEIIDKKFSFVIEDESSYTMSKERRGKDVFYIMNEVTNPSTK